MQLLPWFVASDIYLKPTTHVTLPNKRFSNKLGFDEVYMINLKRRPDRYEYMDQALKELGIDYKYFEAVDGR